jgi:hypothetical protein
LPFVASFSKEIFDSCKPKRLIALYDGDFEAFGSLAQLLALQARFMSLTSARLIET